MCGTYVFGQSNHSCDLGAAVLSEPSPYSSAGGGSSQRANAHRPTTHHDGQIAPPSRAEVRIICWGKPMPRCKLVRNNSSDPRRFRVTDKRFLVVRNGMTLRSVVHCPHMRGLDGGSAGVCGLCFKLDWDALRPLMYCGVPGSRLRGGYRAGEGSEKQVWIMTLHRRSEA